jgi:molybdopterin molybdotransferase
MSWRSARRAASAVGGLRAAEVVTVAASALGRTLAEAVYAPAPMPRADTAAMDGFAVAGPGPWRVVGRIMAGDPPHWTALRAGTALEVMTGAVVPPGSAVVPYERCLFDGHTVDALVGGKDHIRRVGEDAQTGDELIPAGRKVTAAALGLLAQAGVDSVAVFRRPRVRIVVTGDEVRASGRPAPEQVRDALGPLVTAFALAAGADVDGCRLLGDDADDLAGQLRAGDDPDVVVVTGSSSRGAADHLRRVLHDAGARLLVDGVACRPGHPQLLATLPSGAWVVGIPGNPFAGLVACTTLLRPLLYALSGGVEPTPLRVPVRGSVESANSITRLVPVTIAGDHAVVVPGARPASLRAAAIADALAVVEDGWTSGAPADLLMLP